MPRVARQFSTTGFYHIMMRGINRESIFKKEAAKKRMLNILAEKSKDCHVGIFAYCVMDNHVHLLLKAQPQNLIEVMKKSNGSFAMYYNRTQKRGGPVFQDRYRSECVEDEVYFWGVLRYIHLNPVKAHIVISADEYKYSSMKDYLTGKSKLLSDEAFDLKHKNFKDNKSFLKMHQEDDLYIYLDIKEELDTRKRAVARNLIDKTLTKHGVKNVIELRKICETEAEKLLGSLVSNVMLSYKEITELTGLSYSMVCRLVSKPDK